jgi:phage-related protein
MNKTLIIKEGNENYDYKIEFKYPIDVSECLKEYKDCNIIEERYIDDVLVETIIHKL